MFNHISIFQYLAVLLAMVIIYYVYVGFRYYSDELRNLLKPQHSKKHDVFYFDAPASGVLEDEPLNQIADYHDVPFEETSDDTFDRIEELIGKLKPVISDASRKNLPIGLLKENLSLLLQDFPDLKKSPFCPAITELIHTECKDTGSIELSEQEVQKLWEAHSAQ